MKKLKILNLYAGIGGNRKLWIDKEIDVTAIELDPATAAVYQKFYPKDKVIVSDAHEYLIKHANKYDFIWSSPPCPSHSDIRRCGVHSSKYPAVYPDMKLYQEIIFLQNFFKGLFVVENVKPYYPPLIRPSAVIHRHLFWTNFDLPVANFEDNRIHNNINSSSEVYGITIQNSTIQDKRKALRNMVNPEISVYILEKAKEKLYKSYRSTRYDVGLFYE